TGGYLVLIVQDDFKLKEVYRTNAPDVPAEENVEFKDPIIDANDGKVFKFIGTEATDLEEILNGVEGKIITIYGNNESEADLVIDTIGNIVMSSKATLTASTHYVQLI